MLKVEVTKVSEKGNDWKKTGKKVLKVLIEVLIAGALAYVVERPELVLLAPLIEGALDWYKHKE